MTRFLRIVTAAICAALSGPIALAQSIDQPGYELDLAFFASVANRGDSLMPLLDSAFIYKTTQSSLLGRQQLIDHLKQGKTQVRNPSVKLRLQTLSGDTLVTAGRLVLELSENGSFRPIYSDYTHVWTRSGSSWRLLYRETRLVESAAFEAS